MTHRVSSSVQICQATASAVSLKGGSDRLVCQSPAGARQLKQLPPRGRRIRQRAGEPQRAQS